MAVLGVLAVLAVLALPVAVIVLLISVWRLKERVTALELRMGEPLAPAWRVEERSGAAAPTASPVPPPSPTPAPEAAEPAPETKAVPEPVAAAAVPHDPWGSRVTSESPAPTRAGARALPAAPSGPSVTDRLGAWLKVNWVYAVSALSLALAGIFFVQYGIEKGLLPPALRVAAAILFGLALIGGGEVVRRRWGDREADVTAHLPSTFSGAGIVSIFGGILAARQLYGLIGAGPAFAGLFATALLAIVLGWFYGPFLAAVGLVGAGAAPFLVGGESDAPYWLYAYYLLVAGMGLFVDTIRRWAWVSVLALVIGYAGTWLVLIGTGGAGWAALAFAALAAMAILVPARGLSPDQAGPMAGAVLWNRSAGRAAFPVLLAAGAVAASTVLLLVLPAANAPEQVLVLLALAALVVALAVWAQGAPGLADLAALPALAFVIRVATESRYVGTYTVDPTLPGATPVPVEGSGGPATIYVILALALAQTLAAALTSGRLANPLRAAWAAGAALAAPLTALALELFWQPGLVIGTYPWALIVIALAALMVGLALSFARADGGDMRRAAYATLSALSLIALALFLVATKGALTLALGALLISAAALDRRFRLPEMGWFAQAAVLLLSWRLIVDPGLPWAIDEAALWEVVASYAGVALAAFAALWLIRDLPRPGARAFLESGGAAAAALFANVIVSRWLMEGNEDRLASHWGIALNAMPWLIVALVQLYRMALPGWMRWVRAAVAGVAGLIWVGGTIASLTVSNPAGPAWGGAEHLVRGPLLLDTLLVAYALPGLILLAAWRYFGHLHQAARIAMLGTGAALVTVYAVLDIRRFWRGPDLSVPGVTQPELYSYTVAMMAVGAALLYQAIARNSQTLRRVAMAVIGLTIAKVFLVDAAGLTGLTRVFSFLALGLSLAALAWLNRWAAGRQGDQG